MIERRIPTDDVGFREAILQFTSERIRVIAEEDRAHAFIGGRNQHRTERAIADGKANRGSIATPAKRGRSHAESFGRSRIKASIRLKSGRVNRFGDCSIFRKFLPNASRSMRDRVGFRRHADDRFEHPVKVEPAEAHRHCEFGQSRSFLRTHDRLTSTCHRFAIAFDQRCPIRPTAFARSEASSFGIVATRVKPHIFTIGPPRHTRRSAKDTRRLHRVEKATVRRAVA